MDRAAIPGRPLTQPLRHQRLQVGLGPCAPVRDDFARSDRAAHKALFQRGGAAIAREETGGEEVARAGQVFHLRNNIRAHLRAFIAERTEGYFASQVAYGKTGNPEMPVFVETLSIHQIWHVTNFVFSLGPVPEPATSLP